MRPIVNVAPAVTREPPKDTHGSIERALTLAHADESAAARRQRIAQHQAGADDDKSRDKSECVDERILGGTLHG